MNLGRELKACEEGENVVEEGRREEEASEGGEEEEADAEVCTAARKSPASRHAVAHASANPQASESSSPNCVPICLEAFVSVCLLEFGPVCQ